MSKSAEKVYQMLRAMILSGELAQGAPLREEEVAEMCGVSRTPVRDAMRQLEAEMFIRRTESQRSFVAEWTLSTTMLTSGAAVTTHGSLAGWLAVALIFAAFGQLIARGVAMRAELDTLV